MLIQDETNPQLIGSLMYLINTRLDSCRFRLSIRYNGPEEHILMFSLKSSMISYCSRKYNSVALNALEIEYIYIYIYIYIAVSV
jgi:hypothetical protein